MLIYVPCMNENVSVLFTRVAKDVQQIHPVEAKARAMMWTLLNTTWCFDEGYFPGILIRIRPDFIIVSSGRRSPHSTISISTTSVSFQKKVHKYRWERKKKPREHSGGIIDTI